jgi:hypothetical protein
LIFRNYYTILPRKMEAPFVHFLVFYTAL